jgi:hypothetical protein
MTGPGTRDPGPAKGGSARWRIRRADHDVPFNCGRGDEGLGRGRAIVVLFRVPGPESRVPGVQP